MKQKYYQEIKDLEDADSIIPVDDPNNSNYSSSLADQIDDGLIGDLFDKDRVVGYSTGFKSIDNLIGGIKTSRLTVLVAGTGTGKSLFALSVLVNLNRDQKVPVAYIDLENGKSETVERLIRVWHGENLPANFFTADNSAYKSDLKRMVSEFETFRYYSHDDYIKAGKSINKDIILKTVRYEAVNGAKVILVDPLECIPGEDAIDKQREEGQVVRGLKQIAEKYGVAIILCHHLRKTTSNNNASFKDISEIGDPKLVIPSIDDVRGTSEIGNAANYVWGLVRANTAGANGTDKTLLRLLKNRHGAKGDAYIVFSASEFCFRDMTTNEAVDFYSEKLEKIKKAEAKKAKQGDLFNNFKIEKVSPIDETNNK